MNDATKVREAAERLARFAEIAMRGTPSQAPAYRDAAYMEVYNGKSHTQMADQFTVADAYLREHDPTPLTVERLVERGGVRESSCSHHIRFPFGLVVAANPDGDWYWRVERDEWHSSLLPERVVPRTVGELAMLELLTKGR